MPLFCFFGGYCQCACVHLVRRAVYACAQLGELAFKGVFSVGFPAAWLGGFPCASGAKNGRKMAGAGPPWFSAHYLEGRFFDPMRHLEAPAALCSPAKPAIFF